MEGDLFAHLCVYHKGEDFPVLMCSGCTNKFYKILFYIYNTPLRIKLNGFPFYDPVFQFKALSLRFSTKQRSWMGLPILKSGDSYPLGCCLLCSQLCRKWNTAHLLLRASYQIQTQTDTVWLSCSCDLLTLFRRKHQVIAELWQ